MCSSLTATKMNTSMPTEEEKHINQFSVSSERISHTQCHELKCPISQSKSELVIHKEDVLFGISEFDDHR